MKNVLHKPNPQCKSVAQRSPDGSCPRKGIQPKLTISQPNDRYEQEANLCRRFSDLSANQSEPVTATVTRTLSALNSTTTPLPPSYKKRKFILKNSSNT